MKTNKKNWIKYFAAFVATIFVRLLPFRPPNIEPILSIQMPFSKNYGAVAGFSFAFFSMIVFDVVTGHFGAWTMITALVYGVLGIFAALYFKDKIKPSAFDYAKFAVFGTLFFDALTGLTIGPIFFKQSFSAALSGQITFTLWHLAGNIAFAMLLSPAIYEFIRKRKRREVILMANPNFINFKKVS